MSPTERIQQYRDLAAQLGQTLSSEKIAAGQPASERAYWVGMQWCFVQDGDTQAAEQATVAIGPDGRDLVRSRHGGSLLASHWPCVQRTKNRDAKQQMIEAGESLAEQFQRRGKYFCLEGDTATVCVESLLATPLVFYAANETLEQELGRRATQHARTVRDQLVQADGAVAGEAPVDEQGSEPVFTSDLMHVATAMQGFGQCFAFTNQTEFLTVAETNADFWLAQDEPSDQLAGPTLAWGVASLLLVAQSSKDHERAAAWREAGLRGLDRLAGSFVLDQWQQQSMAERYPLVLAVTTAIEETVNS